MMRGFRMDPTVTKQKLKPGTITRIAGYARPYRAAAGHLPVRHGPGRRASRWSTRCCCASSSTTASSPRTSSRRRGVALTVAAVALLDALLGVVNRWFSSRIGEGLIYDLRTQVFDHVQRQPLAFFTRTQTGALVSRLEQRRDRRAAGVHLDAVRRGVQRPVSLVVILVAMFYLSWQIT